jgi:hypothetical protein
MIIKRRVVPPHSLILISELGRGEVPDSMNGSLIAATASCIAVGCRSEVEGETEITLGSISEVGLSTPASFSGILATPRKSVALQTIFNESIIEFAVPSEQTLVSIWVNDANEPDEIIVGLDA